MEYSISNSAILHDPKMLIVGCGGTGGFVAEALCRLMTGRKASITLMDHDIIEPHNLLRQNFRQEEVGQYKSQALAYRLSRQFNRPISYSIQAFHCEGSPGKNNAGGHHNLVIGCVDNAEARKSMNDYASPARWLIDAGNGENWGQVLVGNTDQPCDLKQAIRQGNIVHYLPAPALQRPDILLPGENPRPDVDCAAALDLTDQDPTINGMMAALVLQTVRRMFAGTCTYMALYLDMTQGRVNPVPITPEALNKYQKRRR